LEEACPDLPRFLSQAGNQTHDVHSKESIVQLMLSMAQLFEQRTKIAAESAPSEAADSPDQAIEASWEKVVEETNNLKPHFASQTGEAAEFAGAWSGGEGAPNLKRMDVYGKSLRVRRDLEAGQLGLLAKANLKRAPKWPPACAMTLLQAPELYCPHQGKAKMFTGADVRLMETKLLPDIIYACNMIDRAIKWLGQSMEFHPAAAKIEGDFEVRLVMHVHGFAKRCKGRQQFTSLDEIGRQLAKDVQNAGGDLKDCPWEPLEPASAESAPAATADNTIVKYNADGALDIGQLKSRFGMDLGKTVQLKSPGPGGDRKVYHIAKVETNQITLQADDTSKTVTPGELVDLYQKVQIEPDVVVRSADFLKAEAHPEVTVEYLKNMAKLFLLHAFRLNQPMVKVDFKFTAGRFRHIFSGDKYSPGTLKLVPYTTLVFNAAPEGQEKTPTGGGSKYVQLKLKQKGETFVVTFTGSDNKPSKGSADPFGSVLIVPYWSVQYTSHAAHANMQHSTVKCTMSCTCGKDATADESVSVPILQNTKTLNVGDELLIFREEVQIVETIEPIQAPPRKRQLPPPTAMKKFAPKKKAMKRG